MMNTERWFDEKLQEFRKDVDFSTEELILDLTERITAAMNTLGINRAELAKRLGVSKAFVTKLLNGNPNMTVRTMVSIAKSLGCDVTIDICPEDLELTRVYRPRAKAFDRSGFSEDVTCKPVVVDNTYASAA
jgi:transcriptional regulator with XRE-family HTH domain